MSETDLTSLLQQLKSADESDRRYAVEDLADTANAFAIEPLAELLYDPAAAVREAVVDALAKFEPIRTANAVMDAVASENVPARNAALDVIAMLGPKVYSVIEERLLKHASVDLNKFGLDVIIRVGDLDPEFHRDCISSIKLLLNNENENVAGAALEVLAMHPELAEPKLLVSFVGRSPWLEMNALLALEKTIGIDALLALPETASARLHPRSRDLLKKMAEKAG